MLEFYSAISNMVNSKEALEQCLKDALKDQSNLECDLIIINTCMGHKFPDLLKAAQELSHGADVVGWSTYGLFGVEVVEESPRALGIMAIKGARNNFAISGIESMIDKDPYLACRELGENLKNQNPNISLIYLITGWQDIYPADRCIEGIESVFGNDIPIIGGASTVGTTEPGTSFQFLGNQIYERGAIAIGFADPTLEYHIDISHGHQVFGSPIEITRSEGSIIQELNGQKSWKFICDRMELPESTPLFELIEESTFALELPVEDSKDQAKTYLPYASLQLTDDSSLVYPVQVKDGTRLFSSKRDDKLIFSDAEALSKRMHQKLKDNKPLAVLHVECGSRGSLYYNKSERMKLLNNMQESICANRKIPWLGWYASGEFGSISSNNNYLHFSTVICVITRINE